MRIALGASRGRLIRDVIGESLLLSLLGGAVALALALVSVRALHASIPIDVPFWMTFDLDWRVVSEVSFSLVLLIGAGLTIRSFLNLRHVDAGFPRRRHPA